MKRLLTVFAILLLATVYSVQLLAEEVSYEQNPWNNVNPDPNAKTEAQIKAEFEQRLMVEDPYEAPKGQLFSEKLYFEGNTLLNQYTNIIVVNKAASGKHAQTLRMYINRQLYLTTKVSTGREDVEHISGFKGFINGLFKGATESHWRHTTRGFYTVKRIENESYRSGESKFQMPYALFFNNKRGLAIHQVPPDLSGGELAGEYALGRRASSGCVRVHKSIMSTIHGAVVAADRGQIPSLDTRSGEPLRDASGRVKYEVGYKTLIIVEEY